MRHRYAPALFAVVALACDAAPTAPAPARLFAAVGAHDVARWVDASVPGSETTREGTTLPFYAVCPVEGDQTARATAILSDLRLRLLADGSAELHLEMGRWSRVGTAVVATGETITQWGRWEESAAGTVTLAGFGVPGLGTTLTYTELGAAELTLTMACPSASSVASVQPTVSLSLDD